jgi:hypothetical protein
VDLLIFVLAFFLDFFELSFIVVPLLAPVANKLGIDLIWFGVLLAVNMQTSFMHPPFGFALLFLRSVAPDKPYLDRVTNKIVQPVTTMQIYKGAISFVFIQLFMVGVLIAFPGLVTGNLDKVQKYDLNKVGDLMRQDLKSEGVDTYGSDTGYGATTPEPATAASAPPAVSGSGAPSTSPEPAASDSSGIEDDPMKAMQDALTSKPKK